MQPITPTTPFQTEDPDLIATLIPRGRLAEDAFRLSHNRGRSELTPAPRSKSNGRNYDDTHRIQLTFEKGPGDPRQGFSFGTSQCVDLLLGERGTEGISGEHFCISFGEENRVILKDSSTWGTTVSYGGKARGKVRHNFTWILSLDNGKGGTYGDVRVHIGSLEFEVKLASHETCRDRYLKNVNEVFSGRKSSDLPVGALDISTKTATPSQYLSPLVRPIYIVEQKLGSGTFGRVDKVVDVSTGSRYARKIFFKRGEDREWQNRIAKEIEILWNHPHEHIVQVIDFLKGPKPFLVMPYFPLGSLEGQHEKQSITRQEAIDLLFQGLEVLNYLHCNNVTHRDIKPANILVDSRNPLSIKVADFGVAKDTADLRTLCGTYSYMAPEVCSRGYTSAVDLWSLGLMVFEYAYGIEEPKRGQKDKREVGTWCNHVIEETMNWGSDPLIDLLKEGILKMNPNQRFSAGQCLKKLKLHDRETFGTAKRQISDDDSPTTITPGATQGRICLWTARSQ